MVPQNGFVIELNTAKDRDRLVPASPKLKNLTAEAVFGEGGNSRVSIRQLWPKEVHSLYRVALRACKQHHFRRPIVSNLVVCVRRSKKDSFTSLFSLDDLNRFFGKPATTPSEDMDYLLSQGTSQFPQTHLRQLPQTQTQDLRQLPQTQTQAVLTGNPIQPSSGFNFGNQD